MYKRYKTGLNDVTEQVVTRSLSNLSVLKDFKPDPGPQLNDEEIRAQQEVENTIRECWDRVEGQKGHYGYRKVKEESESRTGWQTVRIFVSSTFTDFYCEREILVKKVFPELREWCRARQLYLIDCDLRWGVPKDTPTCDTIAMCMEELDRCLIETHGQPFFLNLIGEKYGWIPSSDDITDDMNQKYDWVPNTSITFMEILHGAYRVDSCNALFMFRSSNIMNLIPPDKLSRFKDGELLGQQHLKELKSRLESKFPDQVHKYNCRVNGMISQGNKERVNIVDLDQFADCVLSFFKLAISRHYPDRTEVNIVDLDQFADCVLSFFKTAISRHYPDRTEVNTSLVSNVLEETSIQQTLMEDMTNSCLGRKREVEMLMAFIDGQTQQFKQGETSIQQTLMEDMVNSCLGRKREVEMLMAFIDGQTQQFKQGGDSKFWGSTMQAGTQLLCVSAPSGYGKTTLLASVVQQTIKRGDCVFYHFCGSSCNSHDVLLLLKRLISFLSQDISAAFLTNLDSMSEDELKAKLRSLFEGLHNNSDNKPIIIIIDSLNQLSTHDRVHHLSWLPPLFPPNVRCIVSTIPHPPTVSRIQEHPHYCFNLQQLDMSDARDIVQLFLKQFNKKLDEDQMKLILSSECSKSPLWLYLVCEELRVYGDFTSLTKHVHAVTQSVESVLNTILSRLLKEDETGHLEKALCILDCSFGTLTTLDLQRLLGNIKEKEALPTYLWTKIRRNLQAYLRIVHYNEQISFAHSLIKEAVGKKVIKHQPDRIHYYRLLADYIEYWCEDRNMKVNYLATYLDLAQLYERLVNFFHKIPESSHIPPWKRSEFFRKCRCTSLADPVIGKVSPIEICVFCQNKRACKYPNAIFRNSDMCIVCGNQVYPGPFSVNAFLCPFHTPRGGFGPKQCYLCKNVISKSPIQGKLCGHCGFGNYGKQCVALSKIK